MKKTVLFLFFSFILFGCGTYQGNYQYQTFETANYGIETSYAIAFPKGSTLVPHFNQILTSMKNDGTLACLTSYWTEGRTDPCYNNINFTSKIYNYDFNGNAQSLTVLTSSGYEPFEMTENNKLIGFDIDLANFIAKELNYTLIWDDVDFDKIVGDITYNRANLAIAAITPTAERRNSVDFSDIYIDESKTVFVSRVDDNIKTLADLKDKVVSAQNGSVQGQLIERLQAEGLVKDVILVPFPANAMESLRTKKIDVLFVEQSIAEGLLETYNK